MGERASTITGLQPYNGPLSHLWDKYGGGARLADFAINKLGMTIEPQMMFKVFHRTSPITSSCPNTNSNENLLLYLDR